MPKIETFEQKRERKYGALLKRCTALENKLKQHANLLDNIRKGLNEILNIECETLDQIIKAVQSGQRNS